MRLGILGGSFDPVHIGHLAVARACQSQAFLDEVWFLPAAIQPLKPAGARATDQDRIEMLRLALDGAPAWRICTLEVDRGGVSYTVDTLRALKTELPEAQLYFIIGGDVLGDVPNWREPQEVFRLAAPLVVARAGEAPPELAKLAAYCSVDKPPRLIDLPPIPISSTEIRRRIKLGEDIRSFVPSAVAEYIRRRNLYRSE